MVEIPERPQLQLHPRRAQDARRLEAAEGCRKVAGGGDQVAEAQPVLDRHAGALRQRLQRRMGGIADEDDAALRPVPHRVAVADLPAPAEVHHRQQLVHGGMGVAVGVLQLRAIGFDIAFWPWVAVRNTATMLNRVPWRSG